MGIIESILVAVSLCADCFAVSLCSSVTIRELRFGQVAVVSTAFAIIQGALLLIGWAFGWAFVGLVEKAAHIIGFLLLLYVGCSMIAEGVRGGSEVKDLNGFRNVVLGGVATSIDALAVGVSQSMTGLGWIGFSPLLYAVFVVTFLSVLAGIYAGKTIGSRVGRYAEIVGGCVLTVIGIGVLL